MTYYLIDYENTSNRGLKGCGKLKKNDRICIFYSENASKINLDFLASHGKAKINAIKVPVKKQSLDMHIASYIGYLIGKNKDRNIDCKFVIISKDNDYDNIIAFWKKRKIKVSRRENIDEKYSGEKYDNPDYNVLEVELFRIFDNQEDSEAVINIIERCTSKIAVNNSLMTKFKDGAKVKEIYNVILPYLKGKT
ncbi:MAG: PIN domain-containing protein [Ruminococcus flavefaciens]|nr:PIN domain-containing protein [Ruminococcus flavefaciens]MCM1230345.1 PIN domain-containing protein [Ruminococcus flavefaciens]